jgi:hypothetical protein
MLTTTAIVKHLVNNQALEEIDGQLLSLWITE